MGRKGKAISAKACETLVALLESTATVCVAGGVRTIDETKIISQRIVSEIRCAFFKLVQMMQDRGRMCCIQDIVNILDEKDIENFRRQISHFPAKRIDNVQGGDDRAEVVLRFLLCFPQVFYVLDVNDHRSRLLSFIRLIGLSRDYAFYNVRLAMALGNVFDDTLENILLWDGDERPLLRRPNESELGYPEYLQAKTSLAIIRVLDIFDSLIDDQQMEISMVRQMVPKLMKQLGPLGVALIRYFSSEKNFEAGLFEFFRLFHNVFPINDSVMKLNKVHLRGIWMLTETDLLWSYAAVCLFRGESTVAGLTETLNAFLKRQDLQYDRNISEDMVRSTVETWHGVFFLPGDGTIHRIPINLATLSRDWSKKLDVLTKFFTEYLSRTETKRIPYKKCRKLLCVYFPQSTEWDICANSVAIAAFLCNSGSFIVKNGFITACPSSRGESVFVDIEHINIEVPRYFVGRLGRNIQRRHDKNDVITGTMVEIGMRSATILCDSGNELTKRTAEKSKNRNKDLAFCHIDSTTFRRAAIQDFTIIFNVGDILKFTCDISIPIYFNRPYPLTVRDIKSAVKRPWEDDEDSDKIRRNSDKSAEEDDSLWTLPENIASRKRRSARAKNLQHRQNLVPQTRSDNCVGPDPAQTLEPAAAGFSRSYNQQEEFASYLNAAFVTDDASGQSRPNFFTSIMDSVSRLNLADSDFADEEYNPANKEPSEPPSYGGPSSSSYAQKYPMTSVQNLKGSRASVIDNEPMNAPPTSAENQLSYSNTYSREDYESEQSLIFGITQHTLRIMGLLQLCRSFAQTDFVPTGYMPGRGSGTEIIWDSISEFSPGFQVGNDQASLQSILMDTQPVCLVEVALDGGERSSSSS